jgi:hypothetical protein
MSKMCATRCRELLPRGMAFGILLVLVGVLLLARNLGWLATPMFWPLLLFLVGLVYLVSHGVLSIMGHVLIAYSAVKALYDLGGDELLRRFGPIGIIYLGLIITLRAFFPSLRSHRFGTRADDSGDDHEH